MESWEGKSTAQHLSPGKANQLPNTWTPGKLKSSESNLTNQHLNPGKLKSSEGNLTNQHLNPGKVNQLPNT